MSRPLETKPCGCVYSLTVGTDGETQERPCPAHVAVGATVEVECTDGWTSGVVRRNYPEDRWLRLHTGTEFDDINYDEIKSLRFVAPPPIRKDPPLRHSPHPLRDETSFEANQGRGWGPKK